MSCLPLMNGGEIFVPRIPSMKIVDLARAMAPKLPHRDVGIRPGEKIHEVLITEDDSRTTVALGDRYVTLPSIVQWRADAAEIPGSKPVPEGFRYASDTNDEWLDAPGLMAMLNDA